MRFYFAIQKGSRNCAHCLIQLTVVWHMHGHSQIWSLYTCWISLPIINIWRQILKLPRNQPVTLDLLAFAAADFKRKSLRVERIQEIPWFPLSFLAVRSGFRLCHTCQCGSQSEIGRKHSPNRRRSICHVFNRSNTHLSPSPYHHIW